MPAFGGGGYSAALDELYRRYPSDVVHVGAATSGEYGPQVGVPSRDTWGSLWVRYTDEHKGQIVQGPLEDWAALEDFEPPDTASDALFAEMATEISAFSGMTYGRLMTEPGMPVHEEVTDVD